MPTCPPGFADIARSWWGDNTHATIDLSPMLAASPGLAAGTAMAIMMSMWLHQESVMGATYVDMVTASKNLMSLGPTPITVDCPTTTPKDVMEHESKDQVWTLPSPPNVTGNDAIFSQQLQLSVLTLCKIALLRCSHPVSTVNMLI